MMKKVLIFGGTGAMGVYLVDILSSTALYDIDVTSRSNRMSIMPYVNFIKGNARDNDFMKSLLKKEYDIIIDFMNYNLDEFADRCNTLLSSCRQYIWFSSCRVYANSETPITERSPRLLETTDDKAFLATNRYALRKARQEDLIKESGHDNYTIIRPYITYSNERLQLGIYEKEQWLYRILKGRDLVINKDIIDKRTTLTYGKDVSMAISRLVDNSCALGKVIQIASSESMTWKEILSLYLAVLKERKKLMPKIYLSSEMRAIDELYEGGYNTIYDRAYNRHFKSMLIEKLTNNQSAIDYKDMRTGLCECLSNFLDNNRPFLKIDWQYEAYQDILTGGMACEEEFESDDDKLTYMHYRNMPISGIEGLNANLELL